MRELLSRVGPNKSSRIEEPTELSGWRKLSEEWESSGEPQKQFCRRRGIRYSTFTSWRSKLVESDTKHQAELCSVKLATPVSSMRELNSEASIRVSHLSGIKVVLPMSIDKSTLEILLTHLSKLSC